MPKSFVTKCVFGKYATKLTVNMFDSKASMDFWTLAFV